MPRTLTATKLDVTESRLGEGPLWHIETSTLWWTDILGHRILHWDPASGLVETIEAPAPVGALALDDRGRLLASMPDGIWYVDPWYRMAPLEADNPRTRANDGKVDPSGRLVQGTMGLQQEPGAGSVYRIDADGTTERLLADVTVANGLAWSGDGSAFFHIDSPTRQVRRFRYRDKEPLGTAEVAVDLTGGRGYPDGMSIDTEDCLWVALWEGGAVHRYTPDGRLDAIVKTPVGRVTSCTFGGHDLGTLFITTARSDDGTGGGIYTVESGAKGHPCHRFRSAPDRQVPAHPAGPTR